MTLWQGIKLYPKAIGWSMLIRYVHHSFSLFPSLCDCIDERLTDPAQLMLRARRLRRSAHRQLLRLPPVQPPIRRTPGGRLVRGAREVADGVVEWGAVWADYRFDQCVFSAFVSLLSPEKAGSGAWTEEREGERGRGRARGREGEERKRQGREGTGERGKSLDLTVA